jgi:hypothetical protein
MKTLASGSVLLVLFSMFVAERAIAQQGISAPPDTIFYNGKIITVDSAFTIQQAFAVRGDAYVAVGTDAAIRALAGGNTRVVDLKGSAVIPGLSDNHDHLYNSEKVMRGTPAHPPNPNYVSFNSCVGIERLGTMAPMLIRTFARSGRYCF